jgi:hypothetical protein
VLFNDSALKTLAEAKVSSPEAARGLDVLTTMTTLINQVRCVRPVSVVARYNSCCELDGWGRYLRPFDGGSYPGLETYDQR